MVLAKSKKSVGLGNSLMKDRFGKGKASDRKKASHNAGIQRTDQNGETYVTNPSQEAAWVKMRSITEQGALDEFLSTAELAGTDFTAEKLNNVKIIHTDQKNPYLLSSADERSTLKKHQKNRARLTVPRRPKWNSKTTPQQLDTMERESLLEWRRGLAELQENQDILMTPFERNLEVWRQLWRVVERSDLVVQIVDARNPLLFRSADLEKYVKDIDPKKRNLVLINKADMMTPKQREIWADYFDENGINYSFFSAQLAKEINEANLENEESDEDSDLESEEVDKLAQEAKKIRLQDKKEEDENWSSEEELDNDGGLSLTEDPQASRTRILTVDELESLFLANVPEPRARDPKDPSKHITTIGLVGYPNVGKSSTINALLGAKKVSVSATPGKTKHFQTLYLSPTLLLCDCPGLVFPNFATTKAELVVNGILPIDQQREFTGPAGLVAKRIPQHFIEAVYGIKIHTRPLEEGGTGTPTGEEVLRAYARARGFATTGLGQPDESRAARYLLKDYVSGKLLFTHPPPVSDKVLEEGDQHEAVDPLEFNKELYDVSHLPANRQAMFASTSIGAPSLANESVDNDDDSISTPLSDSSAAVAHPQGARSRHIDNGFFKTAGMNNAGHLTMPFNHQYTQQGAKKHKELSGRKQRTMIALEKGIDISEVRGGVGKKHFKGGKRAEKQRAKGEAAKTKDIDDF